MSTEEPRKFDYPFPIDAYSEPTFGMQIPLPNGGTLPTHRPEACVGRNCVVHNPSDHHMKAWPLNWRGDRGLMERLCEHLIGHPDPDDIAYKQFIDPEDGAGWAIHGCCGCCAKSAAE